MPPFFKFLVGNICLDIFVAIIMSGYFLEEKYIWICLLGTFWRFGPGFQSYRAIGRLHIGDELTFPLVIGKDCTSCTKPTHRDQNRTFLTNMPSSHGVKTIEIRISMQETS